MSGLFRVLSVDDEPGYAELVGAKLQQEDGRFSVTAATGAREGLQLLEQTKFDCVVSDYEMPEMNGLDFHQAVKEHDPTIPFVLFTGKGSEAIASDAISAGVTDYLQKQGQTEDYTLLSNRVKNAIEAARADTDRKRQLRAIETAEEGISILDVHGRFEYVNGRFAELYGYESDELVGKHWSITHPAGENQLIEDECVPRANAEGSWQGTLIGRRADGDTFTEDHTIVSLENGGRICRVEEVRKNEGTSADRRRTEARLDRLAETIESGLFVVSPDYERVLFVNEAATEIYGISAETLRTEPSAWLKHVHPDDRSAIETDVSRQRTGTAAWPVEHEFRLQHPEDGLRWVLTRVQPIRDEEGDVVEIAGVSTDITDQKRRERELRRERDRLDEFASFVSHDLRNPLSVAKGYTEIASEECKSEALVTVRQSLDRIDELISDLLTLAREGKSVGEKRPVHLRELSERCWRNVETGDAQLRVTTDSMLLADPNRVATLFENLYRNAITHGGLAVTVTVGELEDALGFYVADDGAGITEIDRERMFERGYSTDSDGTGFGLSIVKQVAEAHGWQIRVDESGAGGARFEIRGVDVASDERALSTAGDRRPS